MNIKNAKDYLKKLERDIESEGDQTAKVSYSALAYLLNQFLETLGKD